MPLVTLRTETSNSAGNVQEDTLSEYICDWPDCSNVAEHVIGAVREIRLVSVICAEHAKVVAARLKR
jgi:hypothetical protein